MLRQLGHSSLSLPNLKTAIHSWLHKSHFTLLLAHPIFKYFIKIFFPEHYIFPFRHKVPVSFFHLLKEYYLGFGLCQQPMHVWLVHGYFHLGCQWEVGHQVHPCVVEAPAFRSGGDGIKAQIP